MFKIEFEYEFFFCLNAQNQAECIICSKIFKCIKRANFQRHYLNCHREFEEYKDENRALKLYELKIEFLQKQKDCNTSVMEEEVEIDFLEAAKAKRFLYSKHSFNKNGAAFR